MVVAYELTDSLPSRERFIAVAIGGLAEVDSMGCTLNDVYDVSDTMLTQIGRLRGEINGGLFAMLRGMQ